MSQNPMSPSSGTAPEQIPPGCNRAGGAFRRAKDPATAEDQDFALLGRDVDLALRRRDLLRRDRVAGLRAGEHAGCPVDRRTGLHAAARRVRSHRRGRERSVRSAKGPDRVRRSTRRGDRRHRHPLDHPRHRAVARDCPRRRLGTATRCSGRPLDRRPHRGSEHLVEANRSISSCASSRSARRTGARRLFIAAVASGGHT